MRGQARIETLYAFLLVDDDGTEGVPAFLARDGMMMPCMGADLARVDSLRPIVREIARGRKVTLAHFTCRRDVEVLD